MPIRRIALALSLALPVSAQLNTIAQQNPPSSAQPINLISPVERAKVDAATNDTLTDTGIPSISVAVVRNGVPAFVQAYGIRRYQELPHPMYITADGRRAPIQYRSVDAVTTARYNIGSNTKQFTAAAIMLLQEQGKLSVDDTVAKYFPELTRANEITLRQLLSHTSGYQDDFPQDYIPLTMQRPVAPDYIMHTWATKPLDYEPGTKWQYSNTGFIILGAIIEKVSGQSYFDYLTQHVLKPVGITDAVSYNENGLTDADALGYSRNALGPPRPAVLEGHNWDLSDGMLCMTATDLARWDISLMQGTLLSPASIAAMTTEVKLKDGTGTHYGFGLQVSQPIGADGKPHRMWSHSGEESGFLSMNMIFPDDQTAVVVLTNSDYSSGFADAAVKIAAAFGLGRGASPQSQTTDKVRAILKGLTQGKIDRSLFTDNCNGYFDAQALADFQSSLTPLGPVVSLTQNGADRLRGGMTFRGYTLKYTTEELSISTYWMPDGKIEQFLVEKN